MDHLTKLTLTYGNEYYAGDFSYYYWGGLDLRLQFDNGTVLQCSPPQKLKGQIEMHDTCRSLYLTKVFNVNLGIGQNSKRLQIAVDLSCVAQEKVDEFSLPSFMFAFEGLIHAQLMQKRQRKVSAGFQQFILEYIQCTGFKVFFVWVVQMENMATLHFSSTDF